MGAAQGPGGQLGGGASASSTSGDGSGFVNEGECGQVANYGLCGAIVLYKTVLYSRIRSLCSVPRVSRGCMASCAVLLDPSIESLLLLRGKSAGDTRS